MEAIEALYATGHWLLGRERFDDAGAVFRVMALSAPRDERSWLALGACHEARQQPHVALELYTTGRVLASAPSYRCELARARVLRALGSEDEADDGLAAAQRAAEALGDDDARAQVERERGVGT